MMSEEIVWMCLPGDYPDFLALLLCGERFLSDSDSCCGVSPVVDIQMMCLLFSGFHTDTKRTDSYLFLWTADFLLSL